MKKIVCLLIAAQLAMFSPHRAEAANNTGWYLGIGGALIGGLLLGSMFGSGGGACCGGGAAPVYGGGAVYGGGGAVVTPGYAPEYYGGGPVGPGVGPAVVGPGTAWGGNSQVVYANGFNNCFNQFQCGANNSFPMTYQNQRIFVQIVPGQAGMLRGRPGLQCRQYTEVVTQNGMVVGQNRGVACFNRRTGQWQPVPPQFAMQFVPQYNNWRAAPPVMVAPTQGMGPGYAGYGQPGYVQPGIAPRPMAPAVAGPARNMGAVPNGGMMMTPPPQGGMVLRPNAPPTLPAQRPGYAVGAGAPLPPQPPPGGVGYGRCGQYNPRTCPDVLPAVR